MSAFGIRDWRNLYLNYIKLEDLIDSFMPESRRANNNHYCKSIKRDNYEQKIKQSRTLQQIESKITYRSRYVKLNTQSYWRQKSAEFRQHSGTIEFDKISNWLKFVSRLMEYSNKVGHKNEWNWENLSDLLDEDTLEYFKNRKQKFENR